MPSSRFIVIKLKDIIKTAVFIAVGIALIITLFILIGNSKGEPVYKKGTYTSVITFGDEKVSVAVTVSAREIKDIAVSEPSETVAVFYPLLTTSAAEVAERILDAQTADIEPSAANPVTETLILDAVSQCLSQAKL